MQNVESLPLSRNAYVIIASSVPLTLTLTGTIALAMTDFPAPVRVGRCLLSSQVVDPTLTSLIPSVEVPLSSFSALLVSILFF